MMKKTKTFILAKHVQNYPGEVGKNANKPCVKEKLTESMQKLY